MDIETEVRRLETEWGKTNEQDFIKFQKNLKTEIFREIKGIPFYNVDAMKTEAEIEAEVDKILNNL